MIKGRDIVDREPKFQEMCAKYGKDDAILAGPCNIEFDVSIPIDGQEKKDSTNHFHIGIWQGVRENVKSGTKREITIKTDEPISCESLLQPLYVLEKLLLVFDGSFVELKDIRFDISSQEEFQNESVCEKVKRKMMQGRPSYFTPSPRSRLSEKLVNYWDILTPELFDRWRHLLDELDIANQLYLYTICDNGMPVDLLLAFLIELAEPMVEIVNKEKCLFPSLKPGERGTTLMQCLNALINMYGRIIFRREIAGNYEEVLTKLKNSRVRVMHIKVNQPNEKYYDGPHSVCYMCKLALLYRVVLLDLLGIDEDIYNKNLKILSDLYDKQLDSGVKDLS